MRIAAVSLAVVLLASCSVTTNGRSIIHRSTVVAISVSDGDPRPMFDVSVYLCTAGDMAPCAGPVSAEQTNFLRQHLLTDPDVTSFGYLDATQAYELGERTLPATERALLRPGDLPASFEVKLAPGVPISVVASRYAALPGVVSVTCHMHAC